MDIPTIKRIELLHPKVRDEVKTIVEQCDDALKNGPSQVRIVQGYRTMDEQNKLFAQGRTAPGPIVTQAPGGSSYHNYGLAVDFALLIDDREISWSIDHDFNHDHIPDWMQVVSIFKKWGWFWGGDFKFRPDKPHFEKSFGNTVATLANRYAVQNGSYVKL